ncbi:YrdB family protein [Streptomyces sp. VRA16 Mangrove soil]|uniref:YrdB family protein n=1 Tax=Streptomyces sp. VRA16 Mangrove soil TaxID=2817434 RepID=UPI001A9DB91C|nr:YrdB family protein [Streptomyces sp. VRA16 Mangrove soil]MBO1333052.1 YrdB family protein [Streptomyces sp. VRA16 Mangrove soil]
MKTANLGVLFAIELIALGAVGAYGFTRDVATPLAWLLGLAGLAVMITAWALFGSQKAPHKTRGATRVAFELVWFGAGVAALALSGAYLWAIAFAALCAVSKALAVHWKQ